MHTCMHAAHACTLCAWTCVHACMDMRATACMISYRYVLAAAHLAGVDGDNGAREQLLRAQRRDLDAAQKNALVLDVDLSS